MAKQNYEVIFKTTTARRYVIKAETEEEALEGAYEIEKKDYGRDGYFVEDEKPTVCVNDDMTLDEALDSLDSERYEVISREFGRLQYALKAFVENGGESLTEAEKVAVEAMLRRAYW